jgi:hypothetical protein
MLMDLGRGGFYYGLTKQYRPVPPLTPGRQRAILKHTVAHCVRKEGITARAGSLEGYCVALLRMYLE